MPLGGWVSAWSGWFGVVQRTVGDNNNNSSIALKRSGEKGGRRGLFCVVGRVRLNALAER